MGTGENQSDKSFIYELEIGAHHTGAELARAWRNRGGDPARLRENRDEQVRLS